MKLYVYEVQCESGVGFFCLAESPEAAKRVYTNFGFEDAEVVKQELQIDHIAPAAHDFLRAAPGLNHL